MKKSLDKTNSKGELPVIKNTKPAKKSKQLNTIQSTNKLYDHKLHDNQLLQAHIAYKPNETLVYNKTNYNMNSQATMVTLKKQAFMQQLTNRTREHVSNSQMDTIVEKRNNIHHKLPYIANNTRDQWFANVSRMSDSVGEDDKSKTRYKSQTFELGPSNKLNKKSKHLFNNLKKAYFGGSYVGPSLNNSNSNIHGTISNNPTARRGSQPGDNHNNV